MLKAEVTRKWINRMYKNVLCIGYCDLSYLLQYTDPSYYWAGVYGWNCDIYSINYNTCLTTGYRPFGKYVDYNLVKKYDDLGKELYNYKLDYQERKEQAMILLQQFINEAMQ